MPQGVRIYIVHISPADQSHGLPEHILTTAAEQGIAGRQITMQLVADEYADDHGKG